MRADEVRLPIDLLDAIADAIVVADAVTGQRVYANRAVLELAGVSREELAGVPLGAPSTLPEAERINGAIAEIRNASLEEARFESHIQRPDGSRVPVEIRMSRCAPPAGDGHPLIVFVARDIGEQRRAEQAVRSAFERSPVGMALVRSEPDGSRRVLLANDAVGHLLGVTAASLIGTVLDDHVEAASAGASPLVPPDTAAPFGRRCRVRRADGAETWIEERTTVLPDTAAYELTDSPVADGSDPVWLVEMVDVSMFEIDARHRRLRARSAELVARISQAMLAGQPIEVSYLAVAEGIADVLGAQHVALSMPDASGRHAIVAGVGPLADAMRRGEIPVNQAFVAAVASLQRAVVLTPPASAAARMPGGVGPLAGVRFGPAGGGAGGMTVMRPPGAAPFEEAELDVLTDVAAQLALAVALGAARIDRERLDVLEERQRIATRLHDTVVQDLVASGMVLGAHLAGQPADSAALRAVVEQLDATVERLREVVFDLAAQDALDALTASTDRG